MNEEEKEEFISQVMDKLSKKEMQEMQEIITKNTSVATFMFDFAEAKHSDIPILVIVFQDYSILYLQGEEF